MQRVGRDVALVDRLVAAEDRLAEAGAEVIELDVGRVVRQRAFPHVFDANLVRRPRLDRGDLDASLRRLEAPLAAVGARHLQLTFDERAPSDRLALDLRRRGFARDRLIAMALRGSPARRATSSVEVRAVHPPRRNGTPPPVEPARPLAQPFAPPFGGPVAPFSFYETTMDRMSREEPWYTPAVSREIIGSLAAKAVAGILELYVAVREERPVGAIGLMLGDGPSRGAAAIVTVGTVPGERHQGVAQAMVVTLADRARAAGCDLVYLIARADDTPKEMYRKFGFDAVHGFDVWLRPPG